MSISLLTMETIKELNNIEISQRYYWLRYFGGRGKIVLAADPCWPRTLQHLLTQTIFWKMWMVNVSEHCTCM